MRINSDLDCCGVKEICGLSDLSTAKKNMLAFCGGDPNNEDCEGAFSFWKDYKYGDGAPYVYNTPPYRSIIGQTKLLGQFIFTEVSNEGRYGRQFAAFIRRHKLGTLVRSKSAENPNYPSGARHQITVWVWQPDTENLWKWWQKNKEAYEKWARECDGDIGESFY